MEFSSYSQGIIIVALILHNLDGSFGIAWVECPDILSTKPDLLGLLVHHTASVEIED